MKKEISILGCGWLGLPLAKCLIAKGYSVKGATTREGKISMLIDQGIKPYLLKFDPELIGEERDFFCSDVLIINIPPRSRTKGNKYHPAQIREIVKRVNSKISTLVFVSSTSIYPKKPGLYEESYEMNQATTGNQAIFESEQLIKDKFKVENTYILRSAGQMGLERIPGKYYAGKEVKGANDRVNYIHQDDLVGLLAYVIDQSPEPGTYNLVTKDHPIKREVVDLSIAKMGLENARYEHDTEGTNRIISGEKVLNNWGYNFKYNNPKDFEYEFFL